MKDTNNFFTQWMKKNLSVFPSSDIDEKIILMASKELTSSQKSSVFLQWYKPGLAFAFGIALIVVINFNSNRKNEMAKFMVNEPQEMLLHYNDIELMADAGSLSEADWKKIEGLK